MEPEKRNNALNGIALFKPAYIAASLPKFLEKEM